MTNLQKRRTRSRSPLMPKSFPNMLKIDGVRLAAGEANIKYKNNLDLLLVEFNDYTAVGGVFTKSTTPSAAVNLSQKNLSGGIAKALIVNSGNANAFTGKAGAEAVDLISAATANLMGCGGDKIFKASTGVIGEQLCVPKIIDLLPTLYSDLSQDLWHQAARAIMTTDTFPKGACVKTHINGKSVNINGIAKGSGMIAPNMATMLAFIFTDAYLSKSVVQEMISIAAAKSFNCITVDSDMSTSDTVLFFATGTAKNQEVSNASDPILMEFQKGLDKVCLDLAHQIVWDGEGASKFISISITGALDNTAAKVIGFSIANSPLVKTAVAGEDANWGRIVMAIGKSGQHINREKISISFGGIEVARNGASVESFNEASVLKHLMGEKIFISANVGEGEGKATVWTCDLTEDYVKINADYRS